MKKLSLFIFIDALGWEVLRERNFLEAELPHRKKLRSVFGYSSACVPSILSGKLPKDHGHWSFYYAEEDNSPFKWLQWLRFMPLQNRGRVRHLMSRLLQKVKGWTGYFQLYNMPFKFIDRFDYCEKRDLFAPGGMNKGRQIFEDLAANGIPYHVSDWRVGEDQNIESLRQSISNDQPQFAFLYMAAMDALLHQVGKESSEVDKKLDWYEQQLRALFAHARDVYSDVDIFICSDHGMATVTETVNLMANVESLTSEFGKDYLAAYDSTMARFWFKNGYARQEIAGMLKQQRCGRILSEAELKSLGCDFDNHQYGELIFLLDAGKIICPSHMGETPVTGMHGYHPDDPDSDAVLLSSKPVDLRIHGINDINSLMKHEVQIQ